MKKLIFVALLIFPFIVNSQTTLEEWNYVTKGYKIQIESGLDMKKGYKLVDLGSNFFQSYSNESRSFNYKKLIRVNENEVCAIMVEYTRVLNNKKNVTYFCIPQKNSSNEIWEELAKQIRGFDNREIGKAFTWALMNFIADNNLEKL